MSKTKYALTAEQQAKLFTQLKRLEIAGLPAFQAFQILSQTERELKKPLAIMQQQLKAGRPISEAGLKAGLFNNTHKTLVHAAEVSGKLTEVYDHLSSYYTGLSSRIKKMKSRLYLPALFLTLSLFVAPLPALIGLQISGVTYAQLSLGRLIAVSISLLLLFRLPRILQIFGYESAWHRLQLRIPVVADWLTKRQVNDFFFILALMLESGLAFADALPKAVASINNSCLREKFLPALASSTFGASVNDIFAKVPIIRPTSLSIIKSSEQSGNLAGGILRMTQLEAENIGLQDDNLAEWLPRLAYGAVAVWMAYSVLGSQIGTVIPAAL
jgi:general secretion pathway protein F